MPKRHTAAEFREAVKHLQSVAGFCREYDVSFDRVADIDSSGDSELVDATGRFKIRVWSGCTLGEMWDTLIHESAHVLDWHPYTPYVRDHGPTWGVRYAEVYCRVWRVS